MTKRKTVEGSSEVPFSEYERLPSVDVESPDGLKYKVPGWRNPKTGKVFVALDDCIAAEAGLRPETFHFAENMDKVKDEHQAKKGNSWETMPIGKLADAFNTAVQKLGDTCGAATDNAVLRQAIDVANLASFLMRRLDK